MNPQIEHNFQYHPPSVGTGATHAIIRAKAKHLAIAIDEMLPKEAAREKALAITAVENAMMWACAGIIRHYRPAAGGIATQDEPVIAGETSGGEVVLPTGDFKCDVCGWTFRGNTVAEAAQRHADRNHIEGKLCPGNLKRYDQNQI